MKATIDIPDDLYRKVKARVALDETRIRDVTMALYRRWLAGEIELSEMLGEPLPTRAAVEKLERCFREADELLAKAPEGASAGDLLEQGRNRLENPDR